LTFLLITDDWQLFTLSAKDKLMNVEDQNVTQPENRDKDDEERLLASAAGDLAAPDDESDSGEPEADESAALIPPVSETPIEESEPEADESAALIQPVSETPVEEPEPEADESAAPIQPVSETPDKAAPISAAPPRIVSETPLGGVPRARTVVTPERSPGGPVERPEIDDTTKEIPPRALGKRVPRPPADIEPARPAPPAPAAEVPAPAAQAPAPAQPAPAAPGQPPSRVTHTEAPGRPADWADEDISPELAAVLFGERKPAAETPPAPAAEVPAPAAAEPAPEVAAGPIALTDVDSARRLRITAGGTSAAAPDAVLQGKVRYMRIEEPLNNDKGQRTAESWRYFKPDYPPLEGRLVKAVESAEIQYADGSWYWEYERRYSDGGRDRREVRANTDRSYVERHDEVSKLAAQAGKRVLYKEDAAMIRAESEREEKHGFLSGLLGRDDNADTNDGAKVWREATAPESRHARKNGGEALRRRFLGIF
jgi:hypothetical protein